MFYLLITEIQLFTEFKSRKVKTKLYFKIKNKIKLITH